MVRRLVNGDDADAVAVAVDVVICEVSLPMLFVKSLFTQRAELSLMTAKGVLELDSFNKPTKPPAAVPLGLFCCLLGLLLLLLLLLFFSFPLVLLPLLCAGSIVFTHTYIHTS